MVRQNTLNQQPRARRFGGFVSLLKRKANVEQILNHYKVKNLKRSGTFINGSCPLPSHGGPDKTPSFGMRDDKDSEKNGQFKCFLCGGGDVLRFICLMEGCGFNEALNLLKQFSIGADEIYSMSVLEKEMAELETDTEEEPEDLEPLVPTFLPAMIKDDLIVAKYMVRNKKRKFEFQTVDRIIEGFGIGIAYYRELLRIIVPINDDEGNWITFFAQNPEDNKDKLFPSGAQTGRLLFALDRFKNRTKKIILTEGVWDCLKVVSWGYPAVSSFSSSFTPQQAQLLIDNFETVVVAYDADKGGRIGLERVVDFLLPAVDIWHVKLPPGKDPCDCSRREFETSLKRAKRIDVDQTMAL